MGLSIVPFPNSSSFNKGTSFGNDYPSQKATMPFQYTTTFGHQSNRLMALIDWAIQWSTNGQKFKQLEKLSTADSYR